MPLARTLIKATGIVLLLLGGGFAVGWLGGARVERSANLSRFDGQIKRASVRFGVDPVLVRAVIRAESGGRADVVSRRGAVGLMQLLPSTAAEYGPSLGLNQVDLKDPATNILLGTYHLARLLAQFDHDPVLALAAYNAGAARVKRWLSKHPACSSREIISRAAAPETRRYVGRIDRFVRRARGKGL